MKSCRNTDDVVRGLQCLLDPDPTGGRCYECAYACRGESTEKRILKDAVAMLQDRQEQILRRKAERNGKH